MKYLFRRQKQSSGSTNRSCGWPAGFSVAAILIGLVCGNAHATQAGASASGRKLDTAVDSSLLLTLRKVSRTSLRQKTKPPKVSMQPISGPPLTRAKKPGVLYVGADYCPYCASLRWPLILALLRFGRLDGLRYMRSSSTDVYPDTITFSFHGTTYRSDYLGFQSVETYDRAQQSLEKLTEDQVSIFRKFDAKPYTKFPGSIPFLYIGGRYLNSGGPFDPALLKNLTWKQAADKLKQPENPLTQHVLGTANLYTAAFCKLTDGEPASVCDTAAVRVASSNLSSG